MSSRAKRRLALVVGGSDLKLSEIVSIIQAARAAAGTPITKDEIEATIKAKGLKPVAETAMTLLVNAWTGGTEDEPGEAAPPTEASP